MKNLKKNKKGFTLIEMIVVIVIIAILAAIAVPAVMKYIDEARNTKLITHASSAKTSLEAELAKVQAKSTNGLYTADELATAVKTVGKDVTDVVSIQVCGGTGSKYAEAATVCNTPTKLDINSITGYVFVIGTEGNTKNIVIQNDNSGMISESVTGSAAVNVTKEKTAGGQ